MPRKPKAPESGAVEKGLVCSTCNEDMSDVQKSKYGEFSGWKKGPVYHCEGSSLVHLCRRLGEVHHGHSLYTCPKCQGHLGCTHCVDTNPVCTRCRLFANGDHCISKEDFKAGMGLIDAVISRKLTVNEALQDLERIKDVEPDVQRETTDDRTCCRCKVMVTEDEGQYCATCKENWEDVNG